MEVEVVPVGDNIYLDAMSLLLGEELQGMLGSFSSCSGIFTSAERHVQRPVIYYRALRWGETKINLRSYHLISQQLDQTVPTCRLAAIL